MSEEENTIVIAYLDTTEQRISSELLVEAKYEKKAINEELISTKIEKERKLIANNGSPSAVQNSMIGMLNIINERLRAKYL